MQIIELELNHNNFFCPATGEYILKEDEDANHDAASLMGYWLGDCIEEPFIKNAALQENYDLYVLNKQNKNSNFRIGSNELENFLTHLDVKNWVVFKISTGGNFRPWQIVYFVIDMDAVEM